MRRLYPLVIPLLLVVALDQLSKWWALQTFWQAASAPARIEILPGWLEFTPVENRGVAFGLFRNYGLLLAILVVSFLIILMIRHWQELINAPSSVKVPIGVIAGGGIGNLIDRIHLSFVVDFIRIPMLPLFQVFNIADAAITAGGLVLVLILWRSERQRTAGDEQPREEQAELEQTQVEAEKH